MGDQHLADGGLVAHQLHQLIDAVLLQQIFRTLLLQRQPGIEKGQPRTLAASRLRFPATSPAAAWY
jgi:hypothetical protein